MDSARIRFIWPLAAIGASYRCLRPEWLRKRFESALVRGAARIRTGVHSFAGCCLTTRPRRPVRASAYRVTAFCCLTGGRTEVA